MVFVRILLQHLRDVRNALVHADEERPNIEAYLDQIKLVTEKLMLFHLRSGNRFPSLAEAASYLDTPADRATLRRRLRDYRRALGRRW